MFVNRRNFYYQGNPYLSSYNQTQLHQYRENVLATRAKLQAYKEAVIEAELQNRVNNDAVTFVGGTIIDTGCGTPPIGQDFVPHGHVSRAGSTPQSYSLWGSSGDSNTDSLTSHHRRFSKGFCRVLTGCSIAIVLLAVMGIVGVAVYLGYFSSEGEGPGYTDKYVGRLRIQQGDSWMQELTYPDSPAFRAKSTKYKNMIRSVFENSILGPAFENAVVHQFAAILGSKRTGFDLTFQLNLDRRKIPFWHLKDTEIVIQKILEQELESPSPVAFQNFKVDPKSLQVRKLKDTSEMFEYKATPHQSHEEEFELVPLKGQGGILRVKSSQIPNLKKELVRIIPPKEHATITTTDLPSTVRSLSYEKGPWQPINPNFSHEASSSETHSFGNEERVNIVKEKQQRRIDRIEEGLHGTDRVKEAKQDEVSRMKEERYEVDRVKEERHREGDRMKEQRHEMDRVKEQRHEVGRVKEERDEVDRLKEAKQHEVNGTKGLEHGIDNVEESKYELVREQEEKQQISAENDWGTPTRLVSQKNEKPITTSSKPAANLFSTTHSPTPIFSASSFPSFKLTTKFADTTKSPSLEKTTNGLLEGEITKNQFYNRIGISSPSISEGNVDSKNEIVAVDKPTMKDIQLILENLLFLATSKAPLTDLINSSNHKTQNKYDNSHKVDEYQDHIQIVEGNTKSTVSKPRPHSQVPHVVTHPAVREYEHPYYISNEGFPLDRFRYQTKTSSTERIPSTSEIINANNLVHSKPMNIWEMLTTKKPMILDTEIITSTSVNVKYGSSTEPLRPVYIRPSTLRNILESNISQSQPLPEIVIPVISGKDVKYIKVNRTKSNYPNVVIVNVSDTKYGETSLFSQSPVNNKGREVKFSADFLENLSNLLSLMEHQNNENVRLPLDKEFHDFLETLTPTERPPSFREDTGTTTSNIRIWDAISHLSKLYLANNEKNFVQNGIKSSPPSSQNNYAFPSTSSNAFSSEQMDWQPKEGFPFHSATIPTRKPSRKSGKSLKFPSTLTLFVIGKENGRGAKVISVSGRSDPVISSSTTNSPIHVFTIKEGQTLEELLSEIIEAISKDTDTNDDSSLYGLSGEEQNERGDHSNLRFSDDHSVGAITSKPYLPAGEDSLKIIESLSKLLTDHYDNYNLVFGGGNHDTTTTARPQTTTTSATTTTTTTPIKLDSSPFVISPATNKLPVTSKYPEKATSQTYHKYYHDLFPVMTRPMNPIRTTTPRTGTTMVIDNSVEKDEPTTTAASKVEFITSLDVSYSMFTGTKNISFPVRDQVNSTECLENEFRCASNKCIPLLARCNMVRDCSDNSDEMHCNCSDILKNQHYKRKICDGIIDCWDKSDETNCDWCSPGHFICTGYRKCVEPELVCDGFPDCPNGDDERDCVTIAPNVVQANDIDYFDEGYLMVRRRGIWGKLCVENFESAVAKADVSWSVSDLGDAVCKTLTFDASTRVEKAYDATPPISRSAISPYYEVDIVLGQSDPGRQRFFRNKDYAQSLSKRSVSSFSQASELLQKPIPPLKGSLLSISEAFLNQSSHPSRLWKRDARSNFDLTLQFQKTNCLSRDVVKVKCEDLQCGVRPRATTQQARIIGGSNSSPGAWPWHAALYKEGEYQCGATLISSKWLISAGHCFYSATNDYWVARMGALRRGTTFPSPFEQLRVLSHIFIHPDYVSHGYINDIAMVRMKDPVKLNDYVRPVCLPTPGAEITDGQRCTLVGWGQLFEVKKIFPDTLQEVEVPLISTKECQKRTLFFPLYRITEDMFCAGYDRGGRDACLGDSGGPLMCQKPDGRWKLMGVTSNGYGCARPHRPGVYTKVVNYLSWIEQVLELGKDERVIPLEKKCDGLRCPLGECIPPDSICNGRMECSDGSDEEGCP